MRDRWDDKGDDLDEPVTITGKELRSLKMKASAGLLALFLSLIAAGAAGWTIYQGTKAPAPVLPEATTTQAPAAVDTAAAQPASTAPEGTPTASATPAPEPAAVTAQPSTPTPPARHKVKAVNATSVGHARYGRATAPRRSSSPAPKMESFDPAPAAPSAGVPAQTPIVPTAPVKSAPPDTSSHH